MAGRREHQRRLDAARAIRDGARTLPRLWAGSWAALVFLSLLMAVAPWVPAGGCGFYGAALGLTGLGLWGGLTRLGVSPDVASAEQLGLKPGGLQFGVTELRILFAAFLNLLFLAMIGVVLGLVALALTGIAELNAGAVQTHDWAAVGPAWKLALLSVVGLVVVLIPLLLIVRLSLFSQATVGRGHTVSLNTMGIAHGSFWPLVLLLLVAAAPGLVLLLAAGWFGPAPLALVLAVLAWVQAPWAAALMGAAYRQLEYWTPGGDA